MTGLQVASQRSVKMKIKLVKPYGLLIVGDIVDIPASVAQLLIQRQIAMPYDDDYRNNWNKRLGRPPLERKKQSARK